MNCTECGGEVGANDNYCPHCGVVAPGLPADAPTEDPTEDLEASDAPRSGSVSLEDQIAALRSTIEDLQVELGQNSGRLLALEHMFNVPGVRPAGQQPHDPQPAPASAAAENQPTATTGGDSVAPQTATTSQTRPAAESSGVGWFDIDPDTGIGWLDSGLRKVPTLDWEWLFGGNWLARIGIVALVVGVGFFLKLAFDNQWIGEIGRVSLGIAGGLALLGFGEFWRRRYPIWAQPVTAGGLAILYLAVYAASALYGLIPPLPALGFFFLVTLTAAALALRYEALTIAIIGILSGFATPLILADLLPDQLVLLAYVLVLDVGVLALATFRNWRWFTLLALVGSVALYIFWRDSFSPGILVAQSGLTAIFLIFVGATTLFHLLWRRMPGRLDQALIVLNGMAYFGLSYYQLEAEYGVWMGAFAVLLALFYGLLGYGILARHREQVVTIVCSREALPWCWTPGSALIPQRLNRGIPARARCGKAATSPAWNHGGAARAGSSRPTWRELAWAWATACVRICERQVLDLDDSGGHRDLLGLPSSSGYGRGLALGASAGSWCCRRSAGASSALPHPLHANRCCPTWLYAPSVFGPSGGTTPGALSPGCRRS